MSSASSLKKRAAPFNTMEIEDDDDGDDHTLVPPTKKRLLTESDSWDDDDSDDDDVEDESEDDDDKAKKKKEKQKKDQATPKKHSLDLGAVFGACIEENIITQPITTSSQKSLSAELDLPLATTNAASQASIGRSSSQQQQQSHVGASRYDGFMYKTKIGPTYVARVYVPLPAQIKPCIEMLRTKARESEQILVTFQRELKKTPADDPENQYEDEGVGEDDQHYINMMRRSNQAFASLDPCDRYERNGQMLLRVGKYARASIPVTFVDLDWPWANAKNAPTIPLNTAEFLDTFVLAASSRSAAVNKNFAISFTQNIAFFHLSSMMSKDKFSVDDEDGPIVRSTMHVTYVELANEHKPPRAEHDFHAVVEDMFAKVENNTNSPFFNLVLSQNIVTSVSATAKKKLKAATAMTMFVTHKVTDAKRNNDPICDRDLRVIVSHGQGTNSCVTHTQTSVHKRTNTDVNEWFRIRECVEFENAAGNHYGDVIIDPMDVPEILPVTCLPSDLIPILSEAGSPLNSSVLMLPTDHTAGCGKIHISRRLKAEEPVDSATANAAAAAAAAAAASSSASGPISSSQHSNAVDVGAERSIVPPVSSSTAAASVVEEKSSHSTLTTDRYWEFEMIIQQLASTDDHEVAASASNEMLKARLEIENSVLPDVREWFNAHGELVVSDAVNQEWVAPEMP